MSRNTSIGICIRKSPAVHFSSRPLRALPQAFGGKLDGGASLRVAAKVTSLPRSRSISARAGALIGSTKTF
ncbi:Hypothetical predicted protein [Cloeon dipterum]|uniref:Uncharacterized protein n=1 Tax=Cloeon dipterum TaxID=197152 RepID=A0A8S1D0A0_9INSE|nr:Hypothetical predicted protein [Cloeon dipterum]